MRGTERHGARIMGSLALATFAFTAVWTTAVARATVACAARAPLRGSWKFAFGTRNAPKGFLQVLPTSVFNSQLGYGFLNPLAVEASEHGVCSEGHPFLFSVQVPEGNYDLKIELGADGPSTTTVKAEARRLLIDRIQLSSGQMKTREVTVNVRSPKLNTGQIVRLKSDEQNEFDWDDQLTLEFTNARPCVSSLEVKPNGHAITVYLAGDSTVTDQRREPWAAWGQMLPRFFKEGVAIANHAESGESLKSFMGEKRLLKLLETIKAGDYLFIQFAHNDQKPGSSHLDPFTTYQEHLRHYIDEARSKNAIPVLVTSMHRRSFDEAGKIVNTLDDYPEAMRQLAREEGIRLIDLNAMSKLLFEALGPQGSLKAFVHFPAGSFPGQTQELKDDTHFTNYGAYELARCVVEGIRANKLGLAKYLVKDAGHFDPAHPDSATRWNLLLSPFSMAEKPEGK